MSQRVHVGIWYILRAQRGSHIPTLRPKYIPYTYMDPLGVGFGVSGSTYNPKQVYVLHAVLHRLSFVI